MYRDIFFTFTQNLTKTLPYLGIKTMPAWSVTWSLIGAKTGQNFELS